MPRTPPGVSTDLMISVTVRPRFGLSGVPQACFELLLRRGVVDPLVVGVEHRDQAGVRRPLHVVLAAQAGAARCQAGRRCR